ncbi:MAG: putative drug exporter of the superfamily, partial [Acidimicrobiaceae bacterium]|nr:putative drug exporter of the superfamily [Acidimicrobiaceae bacterium]
MTLAALARWCFRRRRLVLGLWVAALVGLNAIGGIAGSAYSNNFNGGNSDSQRAFDLLRTRFPARAGDTADVVFSAPQGVDRPDVRQAMEGLFARFETGRVEHVVGVQSPYADGPGAENRISRDGKVAYATIQFDDQAGDLPTKAAQPVLDAVDAVRKQGVPGLQVESGGEVVTRALQPPQGAAELIGLLAAIVILFLAFGSLLAMG